MDHIRSVNGRGDVITPSSQVVTAQTANGFTGTPKSFGEMRTICCWERSLCFFTAGINKALLNRNELSRIQSLSATSIAAQQMLMRAWWVSSLENKTESSSFFSGISTQATSVPSRLGVKCCNWCDQCKYSITDAWRRYWDKRKRVIFHLFHIFQLVRVNEESSSGTRVLHSFFVLFTW